jgi:uncharacterized protein YodC (DUF2158 family)
MAKVIFEPGDVVQLNSGGTLMTVEAVNGDSITCVWHDSDNKVVEHVYNAKMLKVATNSIKPNGKTEKNKGGKSESSRGRPGDWQGNPGRLKVAPKTE